MATYTTADREAIKAAVLALARGERVVQASFGGRTETYSEVDLDKLMGLLATIEADLSATAGESHGTRFAATSKGVE